LLVGLIAAAMPCPGWPGDLRAASEFSAIANPRARASALFEEAGKVFRSPRCVNCHPAGEQPLQTDRMRPHQPRVLRGPDGHGMSGLPCGACHGRDNFHPARIPGSSHWGMAPAQMVFQGRSPGRICMQIKDPAQNGGRDLAALIEHVMTDSLIQWAWSPGPGRTPPPGTYGQFLALMQAWVEAGAECPPP
jgi:hypothetical protein